MGRHALIFLLGLSFSAFGQETSHDATNVEQESAVNTLSSAFHTECVNLTNKPSVTRPLIDKTGNVIGSFEGLDSSNGYEYLVQQLLRISNKEIVVSKLPSYRWLQGGRLLLFGNHPQSHRGGGIVIDIVNIQSGQSTGLIDCGSAVSSAPVVTKDGSAWFATIHGEGDRHMSVLKVSSTNEISVEGRLPILMSTGLAISPNGQKILCYGTQLGMFQAEYYLLSADGSNEPQKIAGLLNHSTWINDNEIFTTNGYAWRVISPQPESSQVKLNWFNSPLDFVNAIALLQGSGLILVGSRKVNPAKSEMKEGSL